MDAKTPLKREVKRKRKEYARYQTPSHRRQRFAVLFIIKCKSPHILEQDTPQTITTVPLKRRTHVVILFFCVGQYQVHLIVFKLFKHPLNAF